MRIGGNTNTYHTHSLEDALQGIRQAGFRYVELSAIPGWTEHVQLEVIPAALAAVRHTLQQAGLTLLSLSAHADLTTDAGVAHTRAAIRWAQAMGISVVNTAIGGHAGREEDERAFLDRIGAIASEADAASVIVALETHGDLMATGRGSAALLRRINHPAIRLNYDTANVRYYGGVDDVADDLASCLEWVAHIHFKDHVGGKGRWDFPPLGKGQVNLPLIFAQLREAAYTGPASVEIEFQGMPWPERERVDEAVAVSFEYLRELAVVEQAA